MIISTILLTILSGLIGTFSMTLFLWLITAYGICQVDMVRALGSALTRSEDNAFLPGMAVHFGAGFFFAFWACRPASLLAGRVPRVCSGDGVPGRVGAPAGWRLDRPCRSLGAWRPEQSTSARDMMGVAVRRVRRACARV